MGNKVCNTVEITIPVISHFSGEVASQPIFQFRPIDCDIPMYGQLAPDDTVLMGMGADSKEVRIQHGYKYLSDNVRALAKSTDLSNKIADWTEIPDYHR